MNLFEKILNILEGAMPTPVSYGWFHILSICLVVICTIIMIRFFRNSDEKIIRIITFICWIIILLLEVYKQIVFSFSVSDSVIKFDYQWYVFPFQFCSTPLYSLPFIVFLKDSKFRDAIITFTATFALFGGLAVMIYPEDVFLSIIGINIQTMIHHGLQVVLGIFFFVRIINKTSWKKFLGGFLIFTIFASIALILNVAVYQILNRQGIEETFNMFYISPYYNCTLPILSIIYPQVPYIIFFTIYFIGFAFVANLIFYIQKGVYSLIIKVKENVIKKQSIN